MMVMTGATDEDAADRSAERHGAPLPADPAQFDTPRNAAARRRGLATPYIPGGQDPDLQATLRRERRDLRLLVGMAVAIVLLGFVLGIAGALIGLVDGG